MARKKLNIKSDRLPDPKYNDMVVSHFVATLMKLGKKSTAERIFYGALDHLQEKTGQEGIKVFKKALDNSKPSLEVKSRRVGGANYQVPVDVRPERRQTLAIRWLVDASRARPENTMVERLSNELFEASEGRGGAIKKKDDVHRMAEANKAFAHFRW